MPVVADSAMWVTLGLAIGAALLALGLSAAMILYLARARVASSPDMDAMQASVSRTEVMVTELTGALDQAREESRRSRQLAEIASAIDIDVVLERTLETAADLDGVGAAVISLPDGDEPLVATVGMTSAEAVRQPVARPAARRAPCAWITATTRCWRQRPIRRSSAEGSPCRCTMPRRRRSETLAVFWRGSARAATDDELASSRSSPRPADPRSRTLNVFAKHASLGISTTSPASTTPICPADRIHISAAIAELRPADDAVSFFQRATEALHRAMESGRGQLRTPDSSAGPA
jgi:hypothetical protein